MNYHRECFNFTLTIRSLQSTHTPSERNTNRAEHDLANCKGLSLWNNQLRCSQLCVTDDPQVCLSERICDICRLTPPDTGCLTTHEGHCLPEDTQGWISPTQGRSIPQMCQSNYGRMVLCMEKDTWMQRHTCMSCS